MINYDISALYSRNVAPFWDVQTGLRYSEDKTTEQQSIDGVIGILGFALISLKHKHIFMVEKQLWGASFELGT